MSKRSDDYIPYAYEIEDARAAAAERVKDIPDPRHEYQAKYIINGTEISERVMAYSIKDAEDHVRQQLSLVGMFPTELNITTIDDTNVSIN